MADENQSSQELSSAHKSPSVIRAIKAKMNFSFPFLWRWLMKKNKTHIRAIIYKSSNITTLNPFIYASGYIISKDFKWQMKIYR